MSDVKWTLEEDYQLIENYPKFKELGKKKCFNYIAELNPEKSGR